jgi:hypothetical protein
MINFREIIGVIWALLTALLIFAIIGAAIDPEVSKDTMCFLFLGLIAGVLTTVALAQD